MLLRRSGLVVFSLFLLSCFAAVGSGFPLLPNEVTHYDIVIDVDFTGGRFSGEETIDYINTTGMKLEEVFLRLYPNAYAIYGSGHLDVEEAMLNGESVAFKSIVNNTALLVPLAFPLAPGERISLNLRFNGQTAIWDDKSSSSVGYGIYAKSTRTMTLASFYPILAVYDEEGWNIDPISEIGDAVASDVATYTVRVTTPPDTFIFTSGTLIDQWDEGDRRRSYRFSGEGMRDFMIVLGKGYTLRTEIVDDTIVRTSFFTEHDTAGEVAMSRAKTAVRLYNRRFGPFVYHKLDLVEVPLSRAGGMEYPGLTLIAEGYSENPSDRFFDIIVAHDVAHQWWYAAVGNDVIEEPWLDEALATYSSALFLEEVYGSAAAGTTISEWQRSYRSVRAQHPKLSIGMPLHYFPDSATYGAFVYSGGAVFLNEVRQTIGDPVFFDALASYYHDHAFQIAHGHDLLTHFAKHCACDLSGLFSRYLEP